jgi:hypothetical protein
MQLQANKLMQNAQTPNLSGSIATDDVDCYTFSCNGIETFPAKYLHLISPVP